MKIFVWSEIRMRENGERGDFLGLIFDLISLNTTHMGKRVHFDAES
jgi:hypothetical protein